MKSKRSKLGLVIVTSALFLNSAQANYCAGIRGNGELIPAHWTALARIVENKGLPSVTAGGSSAAVTQFLLDGITRNTMISEETELAKEQHSLMLKSLVPHIGYLIKVDAKYDTIMGMVGNITGIADGGFIGALKNAVKVAKDLKTFFEVLGKYKLLLNPELAVGLKKDFGFYKKQIEEGIKVFGSFDAKTDMGIFYRSGLVDFKGLGILLGRIADFYAGYGSEETNEKLEKFLNTCAPDSKGKEWNRILQLNPECGNLFNEAVDSYYTGAIVEVKRVGVSKKLGTSFTKREKTIFPNKMIFEKVGSGLNALPTTSVLVGSGVQKYRDSLDTYLAKKGVGVEDFSVDFESELAYGYWGKSTTLESVASNLPVLFPNDLKSSKFKPLGQGSWFEVLATSPAEPGLARLQEIPNSELLNSESIINKKYFYKKWFVLPTLNAIPWHDKENPNRGVVPFREDLISAGGWSDLHPTLVLKAANCDDIVYITRQDGESVFGQQIVIRLTGYTEEISFWADIAKNNRKGWSRLSSEEEASPWNKLYNLANPVSSYNKSIGVATAVYCTDWNKFNVFKKEIPELESDAYHAPIFVNDLEFANSYSFGGRSEGKSEDGFPGCLQK